MISKDEFVQWKNNPVTTEIFLHLQDRLSALSNRALSGDFETLAEYTRHTGAIQAYQDLLAISFEEVSDA